MSLLFATAGAKLFIRGGDPADWIEIKGVSNLGSLGSEAELITFDDISSTHTRKLKGMRNGGSMQLVIGIDYSDPGQLALIAAEATDNVFQFKLQFDDAPVGGTPSERLFDALVMAATEQMNEANNVMVLNAALEIDGPITRIAAAA